MQVLSLVLPFVQLEENSKSDKEQVDETFKQEKLDTIVNFLTDITEKFQK